MWSVSRNLDFPPPISIPLSTWYGGFNRIWAYLIDHTIFMSTKTSSGCVDNGIQRMYIYNSVEFWVLLTRVLFILWGCLWFIRSLLFHVLYAWLSFVFVFFDKMCPVRVRIEYDVSINFPITGTPNYVCATSPLYVHPTCLPRHCISMHTLIIRIHPYACAPISICILNMLIIALYLNFI